MAEARKASESPFPYTSKHICYFGVDKVGNVHWIDDSKSSRRAAIPFVKSGEWKLFSVWPGQWRSDLFEIDDISKFVDAYII